MRNEDGSDQSRCGADAISRRALLKGAAGALGATAMPRGASAAQARTQPAQTGAVEWVTTTHSAPWQKRTGLEAGPPGMPDVMVQADTPLQAIEGFGACFNELGWTSLSALLRGRPGRPCCASCSRRASAPNFTLCRMPVGANDFSRDWYSYDETDGDFALEHFSIANDLETLVPFIKAAPAHQPALKLWASPWSPPTWMKTNRHYAMAMPGPWQKGVENGLRPDQVGREGTDMFVQEERYLRAYASYFGRFVDEYRKQGIAIGMVMPQNEFNSAQVFPSCCWTAEGLARFIAHLGPEMAKRGVAVFFGTMERANEKLVDVSLQDPAVAPHVKGVGFQWAGKGAIAGIHRRYPELPLYQTEQECGDGRNDWRYCRYAWTLMKHYLRSGASAYLYWNISLKKGGVSRWGWAQNSLVTVDAGGQDVRVHARVLPDEAPERLRAARRAARRDRELDRLREPARVRQPRRQHRGRDPERHQRAACRCASWWAGRVVAPTLPADSFSTIVVRS